MSRQRDGTGSTEHDRDPSTQRRRDKAKAKEDEKLEKRRLKEEERQKREREKEKEREKKRNSKQHKKEKTVPTLEDIVQAEGRLIPLFLEKCVRFIEEEGLDSEGIYRVPGNRAHVDILFQKLEEGTHRLWWILKGLDLNIACLFIYLFFFGFFLKCRS